MKAMILSQLVKILLGMINEDLLKKFADIVISYAEQYVLGTASTVDDQIVLPICAILRKTFDIPDNDEDEAKA